MTFLEEIFSRHAVLHKFVAINKSGGNPDNHKQMLWLIYEKMVFFVFLEIELKLRDC